MKTKSLSIFKKSYLLFFLVIFPACFSFYGQQKEVYKDNIQADVNAYLGEYSTLPLAQLTHSILLFKLNGKIAIKFFQPSEDVQVEEIAITTCTNLKIQGNRITCGDFSGRFIKFLFYCKDGKTIEVPGILEDGNEKEMSIFGFYSKNCLNVSASSTLVEPSRPKNFYDPFNVLSEQSIAPNCAIIQEIYDPSLGWKIFPAWLNSNSIKGSGTWAEGVEGNGVNEWLKFDFVFPVNITSISIWNGFNKSQALYKANGRVKKVLITTSSGEEKTVVLSDIFKEQSMPVSFSQSFTWLKLTILEVYPGLKHKDTCISSVTFEQENQ